MSTIIQPTESIYNLIPREEEKTEKSARYTSKFREQVKQEKQQNKALNKTMGPAKVEMSSPDKYLLKHSKEPKLPEKQPFSYRDDGHPRKPKLPEKTEQPLMGIQTKRNFVKTNVIENVMAVPCKPQPAYTDTKCGDKQMLENSGLVPKYIMKKDYGQSPEYLQQRREEGLKKNWEELHHQYQVLSLVTDTTPKKHKKEQLEFEMKQLEKDIELIERYKVIYIANN
ncbi:enkurin isoform X2 [Trichomycterus rosablanca]|uniref:enkurin isoform X2 n=1 Tax=Trichomycterus rosablanca TaxID=2290929 RepID=UPI002F35ED76